MQKNVSQLLALGTALELPLKLKKKSLFITTVNSFYSNIHRKLLSVIVTKISVKTDK